MFLSITPAKIQKIAVTSFLTLVTLALATPISVAAAEVRVQPSSSAYGTEQIFTVTVEIVPSNVTVNAVDAKLKFDPEILSVIEIDYDNSSLTRFTTVPTFSNSLGEINFGIINRTPFTDTSKLVDITFQTIASGTVELLITEASTYATDGLRTNVYTGNNPTVFNINPLTVGDIAVEIETPASIANLPQVQSQVFFDPEIWYAQSSGLFTWQLPSDVTAVAVEVTTSATNRPNNNPSAIFETPISEFMITEDMVVDGINYLSLRYQTEDGWGEILNHKLLIDTTAPEAFTIDVTESTTAGFFPTINFDAVDFISGVDYYEIIIAENAPILVTPVEVRSGFVLSDLENGVYTIRVVAYDRAGNARESSTEVAVTAGWTSANNISEGTILSLQILGPNFFAILLSLVVILLMFVVYFDREQMKLKEAKLRRETSEIQDQMEKIFSALRAEIYEQINTITKRKRLSKAEKEAIEGLNQAIEVSESLIEKEINDVKKVLK